MNFRKLCVSWATLAIALAVTVFANLILDANADVVAAHMVNPSNATIAKMIRSSCADFDPNWKYPVGPIPLMPCDELGSEKMMMKAVAATRTKYLNGEIIDIALYNSRENVERFEYVVFATLYISLAILFVLPLIAWLKSDQVVRGMRRIGALGHRLPSASAIKEAANAKRLKGVSEEYVTLKSLHEDGLITDEAFEARTQALREKLEKIEPLNQTNT